MKKFILIIFFFHSITSTLLSQNDTTITNLVERLTQMAQNGQVEKAINIIDSLNNTITYNKYDARFHILKAVLYLTIYENKSPNKKDYFLLKKSFDALLKAKVLNNNHYHDSTINELLIRVSSHYLYQGTYDFNKKRYKLALKEFLDAEYINKLPYINLKDTILYFLIGQTALLLKDTTLAKKYLTLSFEHNYTSPDMILDLYNIYSAIGQQDSALLFLKKGLLLFPENSNILNKLANHYISSGNYIEARPILEKLADKKDDFFIYYNLGSIYQQEKKFKVANFYYFKALAIKKDYPDLLFNLSLSLYFGAIQQLKKEGYTKEVKQQLKRSKKFLKKYLKHSNCDKDALKVLQSIYKLSKRKSKALKIKNIIEKCS